MLNDDQSGLVIDVHFVLSHATAICDLPSENQPSSHLVVFREIPI